METKELVELLTKANRAYRDGTPIMDDSTYDSLEDQLKAQDPDNEFLKSLDDDMMGQDVKLTISMGSLNKALTMDEMKSFLNKVSDNLHCSYKLDGISCELTYRDGVLVQGATRGDGFTGQNITSVVKNISSIPLRLPDPRSCVVRGEITVKKSDLKKLQAEQTANGERPYKNTRNGCCSIVKAPINAKYYKYLNFNAYDYLEL